MKKIEIWKDVVGFEGFYAVSSYGRVKRLFRESTFRKGYKKRPLKEKILANGVCGTNGGYLNIGFQANGKRVKTTVHRLVATHFIDNPERKPQVNHKDANKRNNHFSNLEWCTQSENVQHAIKYGILPVGEQSYRAKLTEINVRRIRKMLSDGFTCVEIARKFPVTSAAIESIKRRKCWNHVSL